LCGRRHEYGPELDAGEHRLPQLDLVVQHDHDVVAALDPGPAEVVRDLVRPGRELGEGPLPLGTIGFDDPQSGTVIVLRDLVEPVEGEVEVRSEEHTSELQSRFDLVCRLLLEKKKRNLKDYSND